MRSSRIDVPCGDRIETIFWCGQHRASVCQIHAASHRAFCKVLYSHRGHFFSHRCLVIIDGDTLRY